MSGLLTGHPTVAASRLLSFGFMEGVLPSVASDERLTPDPLYLSLHAEFGFTIDLAASRENAKCARFYTREDNALSRTWGNESCWLNHPWSQTPAWVEKSWREALAGTPLIVMLLPDNRTHQPFWQTLVEPFRETSLSGVQLRARFLPGRQHYGTPADPLAKRRRRPKHGAVLLIWRRILSRGSEAPSPAQSVQLELPVVTQ